MTMNHDRYKASLQGLAVILAVSTFGFVGQGSSWLRLFVVLFSLLFAGFRLGRSLLPRHSDLEAGAFGVLLMLALQSLLQTAWFYAGGHLGTLSDLASLSMSMIIAEIICLFGESKQTTEAPQDHIVTRGRLHLAFAIISSTIILGGTICLITTAYHGGTIASIRTPWPLLPSWTLWVVGGMWGVTIITALTLRSRLLTLLHTILIFLATLTLVPLIYRLGFGFDGFLHIAAEKVILATGTLRPLTPYYIGQYVFTTWIARVFHLSITHVDRFLVPLASAILIPWCASLTHKKNSIVSFVLILLLLPLGALLTTTPQAFAYLLGLCATLLAFSHDKDEIRAPASLILALWSIASHPLAGLPFAFITIALLLAPRIQTTWRKRRLVGAGLCAGLAALAVPLMFIVLGSKSGTRINWNITTLENVDSWLAIFTSRLPWLSNHFVVWSAWSTLATQALPFLFTILAIASIVISKGRERARVVLLLISGFLLLCTSTLMSVAGDFTFLITYERGNYAERLATIALLALLPASIPFFSWLMERLRKAPLPLITLWLVGISALGAGLIYSALPRHDALVVGRGWSVGRADIDAVRSIERDADGAPYTVLANQSVAAAAVSQYGFKRYHNDIFFYPIPTGGELYELFLLMAYNDPSRDTAKDAARLGGSDLVYVVINDYWWKAEEIAEKLGAISDRTWEVGNRTQGMGRGNWIFKFDTSKK
jgi:hypothetical protein